MDTALHFKFWKSIIPDSVEQFTNYSTIILRPLPLHLIKPEAMILDSERPNQSKSIQTKDTNKAIERTPYPGPDTSNHHNTPIPYTEHSLDTKFHDPKISLTSTQGLYSPVPPSPLLEVAALEL